MFSYHQKLFRLTAYVPRLLPSHEVYRTVDGIITVAVDLNKLRVISITLFKQIYLKSKEFLKKNRSKIIKNLISNFTGNLSADVVNSFYKKTSELASTSSILTLYFSH